MGCPVLLQAVLAWAVLAWAVGPWWNKLVGIGTALPKLECFRLTCHNFAGLLVRVCLGRGALSGIILLTLGCRRRSVALVVNVVLAVSGLL